jgi:CheY-like chemotaxis protein
MQMPTLVYAHWNAAEAGERAQPLIAAGFTVITHSRQDITALRLLRESPPDAVVIDLSRSPSQGQSFGVWLRQQKATRRVPQIFTGGTPEKTEKVRALLPDAAFANSANLIETITWAIANPVQNPVVPGAFDSYAGAPLVKKLGIKAGSRIVLFSPPLDFEANLGELPPGARFLSWNAAEQGDVVLLFVRTLHNLNASFGQAAQHMAPGGRLWLVWPKKSSGVASDLTQNEVRSFGLAQGFVDYKISAFDATWSGLCFARRK